YSADVLRTGWFAKALHEKFRRASDFRLRELWRTESGGHAMAVAIKGAPADDGAPLTGWSERFDDPGSRMERWAADAAGAPDALERLVPYALTLRHAARRARRRLRARRR